MLQIERIRTEEAFIGLRKSWTELIERIPDISYNLTWEWTYYWWKFHSAGSELLLLAARNDQGELVGLAPWMIKRTVIRPFRLKSIIFILDNRGWHMDIICLPGFKDRITGAYMDWLHENRKEYDLLDLSGLSINSAFNSFFRSNGYRYYRRQVRALKCPYIPLPRDWNTYYNSLDSKLRKNLKYFRRLIEREHDDRFSFSRVSDNADLAGALDTLTVMNRQRWNRLSAFNHPDFVSFHREFLQDANNNGWLRFYQLKIEGEVAAVLYCLYYKNSYNGYQISFNSSFGRYSPGRLIIEYALRDAVAEGSEKFCWGRGDSDYKFEWTDMYVTEDNLIHPASLKGSMAVMLMKAIDLVTAEAKKRIPADVLMKIKLLLAGKTE